MKISRSTLVVCARNFDRNLLSHIDFGDVTIIGEYSNAHRGKRFNTLIFAGFDESHQPSETLLASVIPCLNRDENSEVLFTVDGEFFQGAIETVL